MGAHEHATRVSGWGANLRVDCFLSRPESHADVLRELDERGTISRGLGRSYGDPAINGGGRVIDMNGVDRYLGFDEGTGELTCEAGASLAQIIADFAPRGWFPMVVPGTKFVTVGGCIANDVHGKAHHSQGSFCESVVSMTVLLASGEIVTTSRQVHPELFWGTFGGMGLLGIVLVATIRLRPIETTYFRKEAIVVRDLDALLAAFETYDNQHPYSVAWIDPFATGANLGRGVLTVGGAAKLQDLPHRLLSKARAISGPPKLAVPVELPEFLLNATTVGVLNRVIAASLVRGGTIAHYEEFFFPLDAIGEWYRGYGRRGFTQYQFVIPLEDGPTRMRDLLETIAKSGQLPFLNVLKKFGPGSLGHLSFPFEGYTFAIDFPVRDGLASVLAELDRKVIDAGGRIYLGKDSFATASGVRAMYPRLDEWLALKERYDPSGTFTSNLGRRLGLSRSLHSRT